MEIPSEFLPFTFSQLDTAGFRGLKVDGIFHVATARSLPLKAGRNDPKGNFHHLPAVDSYGRRTCFLVSGRAFGSFLVFLEVYISPYLPTHGSTVFCMRAFEVGIVPLTKKWTKIMIGDLHQLSLEKLYPVSQANHIKRIVQTGIVDKINSH